tara:strand:- start:196 stop:1575 length:1380 start_codon:yes stop_codon:yes gene_type:complete
MEFATQEEFEQVLSQVETDGHTNIRWVDFIYSDLTGVIRGKRVPLLEASKVFKEGIQLPVSAHFLDCLGGITNIDEDTNFRKGFDDGDHDNLWKPIKNQIHHVPWDHEIIQCMISMEDEQGKPSQVDPRNQLIKIIKQFKKLKLKAVVAFELEFYLFSQERDKDGKPLLASQDSKQQVYSIEELDLFRGLLDEIHDNAHKQNIPTSSMISEFSENMLEVNLKHSADLLHAADSASLLRRVIKETAKKRGLKASFMPKPFLDKNGCGCHVHISLYNEKGENVFVSSSGGFSNLLKYSISGMQDLLYESLAIFCPDRNAFRRLEPHNFVPMSKSWGRNNRSVGFRIPLSSASNTRIEHRMGASNANAYLVLSAILIAVMEGIKNKKNPAHFVEYKTYGGNILKNDPMPKNIHEALKLFENSSVLKKYLGSDYVKLYTNVKRGEEMHLQNSFIPAEEYNFYL